MTGRTAETRSVQRGFARMRNDRGDVAAVWLVAVTLALLAVAGLVFDGGRAVAARGDAVAIAQQAARAGADAIGAASIRTGDGDPGVDAAAAVAAACRVLRANGIDDCASITATAAQVSVTVTVRKPTALLAIVGVTTLSGTGSATATPATG